MDEDITIPTNATTTRRKRQSRSTPIQRIHSLLVSRLSTPLLSSLLLLPFLPSNKQHNAIFELVPFYRSLKCLLQASPHAVGPRRYTHDMQQWLSYWTIYSFVRFLEGTRCNVSTGEERRRLLSSLLEALPKLLKDRMFKLFKRSSNSTPTTSASATVRPMTLATQIAGSPTRWTVLKAILLFYAMDDELHGARRIMDHLIKPVAGFFTASYVDEDDEQEQHERLPARRTALNPEELEQVHEDGSSKSALKLHLRSNGDEGDDDEVSYSHTKHAGIEHEHGRELW